MVEHPYIVGKSDKYVDVGEPTINSMPRKLHVTDYSSKPKYMFTYCAD